MEPQQLLMNWQGYRRVTEAQEGWGKTTGNNILSGCCKAKDKKNSAQILY